MPFMRARQRLQASTRAVERSKDAISLENIITENNTVIVNGVFDGIGADGSPHKVGFTDVWRFDDDGLVSMRKTYLAMGSEYVKD